MRRRSSAPSCEVTTVAATNLLGSSVASRWPSRVVLPAPTSPVITTKPSPWLRPIVSGGPTHAEIGREVVTHHGAGLGIVGFGRQGAAALIAQDQADAGAPQQEVDVAVYGLPPEGDDGGAEGAEVRVRKLRGGE